VGLDDAALWSESPGFPPMSWTIAGDLNGDGFSDLANAVSYLGDPTENRVDVTWGAATPVAGDPAITWDAGLPSSGNHADLGGALPAGDVNADGFDDSLVGVSWHTSDLVQANLFLGGAGSRSAPDAVYSFRTGVLLFIAHGRPLAAGDVNGDGFDDILLMNDYAPAAQLYLGGSVLDTIADDHLAVPPP
jgi:hypothetical protein